MGSSDFLFATPTFLTGAARTLDLFATLERWSYGVSPTEAEADELAMTNDWRVVGQDLNAAIARARAELKAA